MSRYFALIVTGAALLAAPQAKAQDFPNHPIKIIVCLPAGGGVDTVTRIVSDKVSQIIGQPIVIENKGGQSGNLGAALFCPLRALCAAETVIDWRHDRACRYVGAAGDLRSHA